MDHVVSKSREASGGYFGICRSVVPVFVRKYNFRDCERSIHRSPHQPTMSLIPAIATVSLGRAAAGHQLPSKIRSAAAHSIRGVEIFYECLEQRAIELTGSLSADGLLEAAAETAYSCKQYRIKVVCLQPLLFFEGLTDKAARAAAFERLKLWFKLCHILETDLIQIPTNFQQHDTTGEADQIVTDLTEAALLGLQESPVIRLAYEGVSWGTHIDTWDGSWEIVKRINLPNLGLCLDTFHVTARLWGDPAATTGRRPTGDTDLTASLEKMVTELDVDKVFYIQVGDAERLSSPITPHHEFYDPKQHERMSWSRNARLFAFEHDKGAHLPVDQVLDTLVRRLGYRGWVSMEIFSTGLYKQDLDLPEHLVRRAEISWEKTIQFLKHREIVSDQCLANPSLL